MDALKNLSYPIIFRKKNIMLKYFDAIVTFQLHCFSGYSKEYYVVKLKDAFMF